MFEKDPEARSGRPTVSSSKRADEQRTNPVNAQLLKLQRAAGNASVAALLQRKAEVENEDVSPVKALTNSGGGRPLDSPVREFMESRLGSDFSDVRIHTGSQATEAARSVQAHAYTTGSDVVFQDGQYNPSSPDGQKMLAHELTHVVQQRSGPVDGTPAPGGISVSDPSDRFERAAEATADRAMAAGPLPTQAMAESGSSSGAVQRQEGAEAEDEELQMSAIQREEAPETEDEELQMSSIQRQEGDEMEEEEV